MKTSAQATYGGSVQFLWDTGWERQQTKTTACANYMDGQGNSHTVTGGQVTFGPEPIMLFHCTTPPPPPPPPGSLTRLVGRSGRRLPGWLRGAR